MEETVVWIIGFKGLRAIRRPEKYVSIQQISIELPSAAFNDPLDFKRAKPLVSRHNYSSFLNKKGGMQILESASPPGCLSRRLTALPLLSLFLSPGDSV
jgi:hypothetical protein